MSAYPRPIFCAKCCCDLRPEKNGVFLLEMADFGPYKLWTADLWKCPRCGVEIISGYSQRGIEDHEETFKIDVMFAKKSGFLYVERKEGELL